MRRPGSAQKRCERRRKRLLGEGGSEVSRADSRVVTLCEDFFSLFVVMVIRMNFKLLFLCFSFHCFFVLVSSSSVATPIIVSLCFVVLLCVV